MDRNRAFGTLLDFLYLAVATYEPIVYGDSQIILTAVECAADGSNCHLQASVGGHQFSLALVDSGDPAGEGC